MYKKGEKYSVCTTCYRVSRSDLRPLKHEYLDENKVTVEPTCTEAGYTKNTCTRCGEEVREETEKALGHDFDNGVVTTEATCTIDGVKTYTCKRCDEVKEEVIPATGHQHTTIINETPEYTGDTYCEDCDTIIAYGTTLDHEWDEANVEITEPTCTETGKRYITAKMMAAQKPKKRSFRQQAISIQRRSTKRKSPVQKTATPAIHTVTIVSRSLKPVKQHR